MGDACKTTWLPPARKIRARAHGMLNFNPERLEAPDTCQVHPPTKQLPSNLKQGLGSSQKGGTHGQGNSG